MKTRLRALAYLAALALTANSENGSAAASNSASKSDGRLGLHWGGVPVSSYTSDIGFRLGAFAQRFDYGEPTFLPFDSLWSFQLTGSSRGQRDGFISLEKTRFLGDTSLRVLAEAGGISNPAYQFHGLGPDTPEEVSQLDVTQLWTATSIRKRISERWELRAGLRLERLSIEPSAFGAGEQSIWLKPAIGAVYEGRDLEFVPSSGEYFSTQLAAVPALLSSQGTSWMRWEADARKYFPLIADRWLWTASQLRATWSSPGAPLPEQARLGSWSTLRGLPVNRYLSSLSVSFRNELRSLPIRETVFDRPLKGGAGLFVETGATSAVTRLTYGISLFGSYFTDDFIGTADLGFSAGRGLLYLQLGHAF